MKLENNNLPSPPPSAQGVHARWAMRESMFIFIIRNIIIGKITPFTDFLWISLCKTCEQDICWRWGYLLGLGMVWLSCPAHQASCKGSTPVQPISSLICHNNLFFSFVTNHHRENLKLAGDTGSVTVPGSILHQLLVQPELYIWSSSSSSSPALQYQWIPIFWWDHNSPVGTFGQYETVACIVSSFENRQPHHLIILLIWLFLSSDDQMIRTIRQPHHLIILISWSSPNHLLFCHIVIITKPLLQLWPPVKTP